MCNILIIDDEPAIRDVLKIFLEEIGFKVYLAQDGNEGLALFHSHYPEVVFLDLLLPERTGKDVLREIRSTVPQTIVIVITGFSEEEVNAFIGSFGVQGLLKKPFRLEHVEKEILPKIRENLSLRPKN